MILQAERMARVETKVDHIAGDMSELKHNIEEIKEMQRVYLEHKINTERDIKELRATHRRVAVWTAVVITGALNAGLEWAKSSMGFK